MKKLFKRLKNQAGLTLIELLAVIVILGILAGIGIPSIMGIIQGSKEDAVKADAITVINMAKMHVASNALKFDDFTKDTETFGNTTAKRITSTILQEYLDGGEFKNKTAFYVLYTKSGDYYFSSGDSIVAGKKSLKFENATIKDINEKDGTVGTDGVVTISGTVPSN